MFSNIIRICIIIFALFFAGVLESSYALELDSTHIIFHAHGSDTTSRIGASISYIGDINNDEYDDIAISSVSPKGTYIFFGGNPPDTNPAMFLKGSWYATGNFDIDGDEINDVLTSQVYGDGSLNRGVVYFYRGFGDSLGSVPYDSLIPPMPNYGFGGRYKLGHVYSDLTVDLLALRSYSPGGPSLVLCKGPLSSISESYWAFSISEYSHDIRYFGFIDFNGDHNPDIYAGLSADLDSISYVYIFLGPDFGSIPDRVIGPPADIDTLSKEDFARGVYNIGDIDGDGWEDLGIDFGGNMLIYKGGPTSDTLYDYQLQYLYLY